MADAAELRRVLTRIDGRGYKAYKDIAGWYELGEATLYIDHVQGDPFASPSKIRVRVPQRVVGLPPELFENGVRRVAFQDFLARQVSDAIQGVVKGRRGTGKSGLIAVDAGGQEVLERTAVVVTEDWVEVRLCAGLPAAGRRVLGSQAEAMLCTEVPRIAERGLRWGNLPHERAREFVECVENQEHIRSELRGRGLAAFVADGALLPRASGASDRPLGREEAVTFRSPERLRVTLPLPNPVGAGDESGKQITGMGIPQGITLIVGGGYHGKSTLLAALERGVYAHIPGDGREYVVTDGGAVKIRAEDGRRVERVDISGFISDLPYGRSTSEFCSEDASGSTSQAANIIEALEVGATVLLLDEDTSATNFMVRDARMQALVHKEYEPITPFLDRVRELYDDHGVSTVMVMGGCGDYFDVADTVIMMRDYVPHDVTEEAKRIAQTHCTRRQRETVSGMAGGRARIPLAESFDASRGRREVKIDAKSVDLILFGTDRIELRGVEQLVDFSQTRAIGYAIHLATRTGWKARSTGSGTGPTQLMNGRSTLREVVESLEGLFDSDGLDGLDPFRRGEGHPGDFARPRKYEIAAAINRLRTVRMRQAIADYD